MIKFLLGLIIISVMGSVARCESNPKPPFLTNLSPRDNIEKKDKTRKTKSESESPDSPKKQKSEKETDPYPWPNEDEGATTIVDLLNDRSRLLQSQSDVGC